MLFRSNIPMAVQIQREAIVGNSGWLPAQGQGADMIDSIVNPGDRTYRFDLLSGGTQPTVFTMSPGEVKVFSASAPPQASYLSNPYRSWNAFANGTKPMELKQGIRGVSYGFYFPRVSANELNGYETYPAGTSGRGSLEYLAPTDRVKLRIRPCPDSRHPKAKSEQGKVKVAFVNTQNQLQLYSMVNFDVGTTSRDGNVLTGLENTLGLTDRKSVV